MREFFNRVHNKKIDMKIPDEIRGTAKGQGTVSTLLIPEELMMDMFSDFPMKIAKSGRSSIDMKRVLRIFLDRYRAFFAMGVLPFGEKAKLTFQEEGLDLREVKFRPDPADWAELGIIAYGLGVSRCWLFSYMLELERSGVGEFFSENPIASVVTTSRVSRPLQILRITGRRRFFLRTLHFRV